MKFALLTIAFATAQLVAAQQVAIRVPPDETEQYYLVSFDQSRASAKDVERWMKFAEYGSELIGFQNGLHAIRLQLMEPFARAKKSAV